MKFLFAVCILYSLALLNKSFAQAPSIQWQKHLGGIQNDYATSSQQTADGGYIVAGYTFSNDGDVTAHHGGYDGHSDYWIVKLGASGNIQWQKCLGGSFVDYAYSVQQTADGGYIVAGYTGSTDGDVTGIHGYDDYWIVKLDALGNIQWQKCLGGGSLEEAYSVQQTADGGYIVAGIAVSNDGEVIGHHGIDGEGADCWIVKLDALGNIQWQKCLGGKQNDYAAYVQQTADGGYIVAGYTSSLDGDVTGHHGSAFDGNVDYWIIKFDALGNIQWQRCLGGSGEDYAQSVKQTADGGYIIAGYTNSNDGDVTGNHGSYDYWIVKLDASGTIQWQKCLGGTRADEGYSAQQTADGGYFIAGITSSTDGDVIGNHGDYDYWTVKLDASGTIQWQKCLGGSEVFNVYSAQQTTDGGYFIAGSTVLNVGNHGGYDYWIVKLSFEKKIKSELQWDKSFPAQNADVKGVAADGTSRLYIKISKTDTANTATFQNVTVSLTNNYGSMANMLGRVQAASNITWYSTEANSATTTVAACSTMTNGGVWFWYVAPDDFSSDELSSWKDSAERTVTAHVVASFSDGTKDSTDMPIKIVRPPLVLVHGLAATEHTWDQFNYGNGTLFINSPLFKQKRAVTLSPHASFEANAETLLNPDATAYTNGSNKLNTLQGNVEELRKQGYACNQVDYVCHSMGGAVLRTAIKVFPSKFYGLNNERYKNYGKGFIHKAITLNTPHNSSPVADAVTEYIPQAPWYINLFFNRLYNWFPNTPLVWDFIQPSHLDNLVAPFTATDAVKNLQVSNQAGGIDLPATPIKNHLVAGDVDIYDPGTAAVLADLENYMDLIDKVFEVMRDNSIPPVKTYLNGLLVLSKTARVFTFIEWYSAQKGFPNFLGDGDLVVPLESQLAGLNRSAGNVKVFSNSSFLDACHIKINTRTDVGNWVLSLLNSSVKSSLFGNVIPATTNSLGLKSIGIASKTSTQQNIISNSFDTAKIKIIAPTNDTVLFADSVANIQFTLKDTVDLAYINIDFQSQGTISTSREFVQTVSNPVLPRSVGSQLISVTAVYDKPNGTEYHTDTLNVSISTKATLTGFTAEPSTAEIQKNQYFYPQYKAFYDTFSANLLANSSALSVTVADVSKVKYDSTLHAFTALTDTGSTFATISYKGFKDTISFIIVPQPYAGCINRTISSGNWRSPSTWERGSVPQQCDSVVIMPGNTLIVDSSFKIRSLYVSGGGTVSISDSTVVLQVGEADDGNKNVINDGTLNISKGKFLVNGRLQQNTGSTFNMSGGELVIHGNTGFAFSSVSNGFHLFDISNSMNSFSFNGGTLQITDPPLGNNSQAINCSYTFGDNSILKFGDGVSTITSNNPNGFGGNLLPAKIGKLIFDAATNENNRVFKNLNPLIVKSPFQIKSGSVVQTAMLTVEQ